MTKFTVDKFKKSSRGWKETIVDRLTEGKVLPVISNDLCDNMLFGSHKDLVESWAAAFDYPLADKENLTHMTQFQSVMSKADPQIKADDRYIKETYLDFLKEGLYATAAPALVGAVKADENLPRLPVSAIATRLNCPPLDESRPNALLFLADFPLPIYLTTSYHDLMEQALRRAGKTPCTEICYWHDRLKSIPSSFNAETRYQPTADEPLVYHLHGLDAYPDSLVLTEDDHLDFLVAVSERKEDIPVRVRQALADSSLLLLGYNLRSWDFRVILRGLIKTSDNERRPTSVSIQLSESDEEKEYLQNYLIHEARFTVHWGPADEFMQDLWQAWKERP